MRSCPVMRIHFATTDAKHMMYKATIQYCRFSDGEMPPFSPVLTREEGQPGVLLGDVVVRDE